MQDETIHPADDAREEPVQTDDTLNADGAEMIVDEPPTSDDAPDAGDPQTPDATALAALAEAREALEAMDAKLKASAQQAEEYLTLAQRVQADFDNFRRRNNNVRSDSFDEGARAFAATLLPVMDNFERALQAATEPSPLREGIEMVFRQMSECFQKRGIEVIDRLGEKFDPNLENAVMRGTPEEGEAGTVCAVFQKGYKMGDMVIRHAMVKVVPD